MEFIRELIGKMEPIDWTHFLHHAIAFSSEAKLRDVYQEMLAHKIDYAAEIDSEHRPTGLISFKMLAATLSGEYGQALMAKKKLRDVRAVKRRARPTARHEEAAALSVVIGLNHTAVLGPQQKFLEAQNIIESRDPPHSFDDIIVVDESERFAGLMSMRDFVRVQINILRWQEEELSERNRELSKTLTQLSLAQAELINQAKMASLGEMVAGIAHEMNTPLGVLLSSHEVIESIFSKLDLLPDLGRNAYLKQMMSANLALGQEAGSRVTRIINSLRTFGRRDQENDKLVNLPDLINSNLVLMASRFKPGIVVHKDMPKGLMVFCYPGQFSQALINIFANAAQAMDNVGKVYIQLWTEGEGITLIIRDTGPGIPVDLLERIFDPGFTTKGVGVGTGLGLSICRKIIELHHGGKITAGNHPEDGAEFRITLRNTEIQSTMEI